MLTRRQFLNLLGLGDLGAVRAGGLAIAKTYQFQINRYRRVLPGLERPLRVVQLSDLRFGPWVGADLVRAWVQASNAQRPDLVIVTGDLVDVGLRLEHTWEWSYPRWAGIPSGSRGALDALFLPADLSGRLV